MLDHVVRYVRETPWAILPATLDTILEVVSLRASGERFTPEEIKSRIGAKRVSDAASARVVGDIAVLPLYGVISQRANMMTDMSGGTSTEKFGAMFQQLVDAPEVGVIVLDVDSPGGSVLGVQELADVMHAARGRKPVVAVANSLAASAAYWLATQSDELVLTPSGEVGSIGVVAVHRDLSEAAAKAGVKVTHVHAGPHKVEGNSFEPLSDGARAHMQSRIDEYHGQFIRAVARGRGVSQVQQLGGVRR